MKKRISFIIIGLLLCVSALAFTQLITDNSGVSYRYDAGHHRPYKIYNALLTQTGTDAPVAIVLENSLGGAIVWTRQQSGVYGATLVGAFSTNKTFFSTGLYNANTPDIQTIQYISEDLVQLYNYYLKLILGDVGKELLDGFVNVPIEIRVYP